MSQNENPFRSLPPLSTHPVDVGRRSEAAITGELLRRGYDVYEPMNVNSRADLIVDTGDRLIRIQSKTGRLKNGSIHFNTTSVRSNTKGAFRRSYVGEVDFFAVFCPETNGVYLIPVEDLAATSSMLRVRPPANNQTKGIRWARDYELPELAA